MSPILKNPYLFAGLMFIPLTCISLLILYFFFQQYTGDLSKLLSIESSSIEGDTTVLGQSIKAPILPKPTPAAIKNLELWNLGVSFAPFDEKSGKAGGFLFTKKVPQNYLNSQKILLEFGSEVATGGAKATIANMQFPFLDPDTPIISSINGVVTYVDYQPESKDYEIHLRPTEDSPWVVSLDHITDLKVKKKSKVKAGDELGKPQRYDGVAFGRMNLEVQMRDTDGTFTYYCPTRLLSPFVKQEIESQIQQLMEDWKKFIGNIKVYDQFQQTSIGCIQDTVKPAVFDSKKVY